MSCFSFLVILFQRLSINVAAVAVAENMMDLIDGYCRLEKDTDDTVIYRPNKSVLMTNIVHNRRAKWFQTSVWFSWTFSLLDVTLRSALPEIPDRWVNPRGFNEFQRTCWRFVVAVQWRIDSVLWGVITLRLSSLWNSRDNSIIRQSVGEETLDIYAYVFVCAT